VNKSIIFRLPVEELHSLEQAHTVQYETEVLRLLQNKLAVDVPNPMYVSPSGAYYGYPKLPGVLISGLVPTMRETDIMRFKEDWVSAALAIHRTVPLSIAKKLGVPVFDTQDRIETAHRILDLGEVDDSVKKFANKTVKAVMKIDMEQQDLVFIHNDLHLFNIIANPNTNRMTGVIDWSDCCIGPLAKEFSVWEWQHDDSLLQVAAIYEAKTGTSVDVMQAKLWMHLEEIADFVEQTNDMDHAGANASLEHIKRWIKQYS
jgi:aminoglycoside phosphotransferase (APT) family kinase protein